MHRVVVPRFSGVHRFACLALYRTLLRQSAILSEVEVDSVNIRSIVQRKFRLYKTLQSPSRTANAMKAGYEAVDMLHLASRGHDVSNIRIRLLVADFLIAKQERESMQRAMTAAKPVRLPSPKQLKREENVRFQKASSRRHPDATSILSRPRPVVKGKRRVPVLVNARGLPFLRIKKPQPKFLSSVLKNKLDRRWKHFLWKERLDAEVLFARDEDFWDSLTISEEPVTWFETAESAREDVKRLLREEERKNKKLAEDMWEVVLAERKLAAEEEEQRTKNEPVENT